MSLRAMDARKRSGLLSELHLGQTEEVPVAALGHLRRDDSFAAPHDASLATVLLRH